MRTRVGLVASESSRPTASGCTNTPSMVQPAAMASSSPWDGLRLSVTEYSLVSPLLGCITLRW